MALYEIYTDGSADTRFGVGAWAYMVYKKGEKGWPLIYRGYDAEEDTTNNEMELYAVVEALEMIQKHGGINSSSVLICSDSQWLIKCLTDLTWYCKSHGSLFKRIRWFMKNFDIRFKWVKAHARDSRNNAVDALAKATMLQLREDLYRC